MPKWLTVLVAAACLVICAAGATYVWERWPARRSVAVGQDAVFATLGAKPGDTEAATKYCKTIQQNLMSARDLKWDGDMISVAEKTVAFCKTNGFL